MIPGDDLDLDFFAAPLFFVDPTDFFEAAQLTVLMKIVTSAATLPRESHPRLQEGEEPDPARPLVIESPNWRGARCSVSFARISRDSPSSTALDPESAGTRKSRPAASQESVPERKAAGRAHREAVIDREVRWWISLELRSGARLAGESADMAGIRKNTYFWMCRSVRISPGADRAN